MRSRAQQEQVSQLNRGELVRGAGVGVGEGEACYRHREDELQHRRAQPTTAASPPAIHPQHRSANDLITQATLAVYARRPKASPAEEGRLAGPISLNRT